MKRLVALISGRGSNLDALLTAPLAGSIVAVVSNEPAAAGLQIAQSRGIATAIVSHRAYANRTAFDAELLKTIDTYAPDLVLLAGFMRVLSADFVNHYAGRILNVHPSLLPSFPGLHTHGQALAAGVRVHGCTVHFVTPALDHGPIVVQAAIPVAPDDDEASLAARVLLQEHRIYPQAVRWFCEGRLQLAGERVTVDGAVATSAALISPALQNVS